ncbi:folylpolyglutamate synthase [Sarocladium implicatum]|nr:folylpolyglutamate synthase [Sarocladium implicatum]
MTQSRTYDDALHKLSLIASNRRITSLFDQKPTSSPRVDLNAQAIPEMLTSLRHAGYVPEDLTSIRHIHVAGTKGKGSVCAFATSLLLQHKARLSGMGVGTYTSPHLISPRERIAVDGQPVNKDVFTEAVFEIWDRFTEVGRKEMGLSDEDAEGAASKPFYFRFMTILAWHIFLKLGIRDVVMECGIGGEYDATNILPAANISAAVITQLGIDHVAMLGDTVEKIAWHKAGILKPGVTGFTRTLAQQPAVMTVLKDRAAEKQAKLVEVDDTLIEAWGGVDGNLKGGFQRYNQVLALLAIRQHLGLDADPTTVMTDITPDEVRGLQEARLRGRCEVITQEDVTWFLDGAHTNESLEQVSTWFKQSTPSDARSILIFNQQERDASHLLAHFLSCVDRPAAFSHALFTSNEQAKGAEVQDQSVQKAAAAKMAEMAPDCKLAVYDNIQETVAEARRLAKVSGGRVLVTGSLHLVGGVLQALEPGSVS